MADPSQPNPGKGFSQAASQVRKGTSQTKYLGLAKTHQVPGTDCCSWFSLRSLQLDKWDNRNSWATGMDRQYETLWRRCCSIQDGGIFVNKPPLVGSGPIGHAQRNLALRLGVKGRLVHCERLNIRTHYKPLNDMPHQNCARQINV